VEAKAQGASPHCIASLLRSGIRYAEIRDFPRHISVNFSVLASTFCLLLIPNLESVTTYIIASIKMHRKEQLPCFRIISRD
jgi:hypothetical protein